MAGKLGAIGVNVNRLDHSGKGYEQDARQRHSLINGL